MSFVPPLYTKFGKTYSDLIKKKYDFRHSVGHKDKVDNMTLETALIAADSGAVGKVKLETKHGWGEMEFNLETDGSVLDAKVKHTKLKPGLSVQITSNGVKQTAQVLSEYSRENVSASLQIDGAADSTKVSTSVAVGRDGISAGVSAAYHVQSSQLEEYSAGVEYAAKHYTTTLVAKSKAKATCVSLSYFRNLSNPNPALKSQLGANFDFNIAKSTYGVTLAADHQVSKDLSVRAMADNEGTVKAHLERRLDNPQLKATFSSQWSLPKRSSAPDKVGLGLTFGEA